MVIEKTFHFYAAHRNKNAGVKCGRIHGHTYDVKCQFKFDEMKDGLTMLFSDIENIVEPIVKQYDHYFLLHEEDTLCELLKHANEEFIVLPFETSAENLAMHLFKQIETQLPIVQIELAETKTSKVIYGKQIKHF